LATVFVATGGSAFPRERTIRELHIVSFVFSRDDEGVWKYTVHGKRTCLVDAGAHAAVVIACCANNILGIVEELDGCIEVIRFVAASLALY
jgi:hypothetical protein